MTFEIIKIESISMLEYTLWFSWFSEIFNIWKLWIFWNFWLNFVFWLWIKFKNCKKCEKKSLWSKNDLYRNKTADINVMQLSMIKFISWQALKIGPKPYYLAPTSDFISPISYSTTGHLGHILFLRYFFFIKLALKSHSRCNWWPKHSNNGW